jgi:hypothetical protein
MSTDEWDAARDEFIEEIRREIYPEHKIQAIEEYTAERLRSFYVKHPDVMRPAVDALQEGKLLLASGRHSAALVFFVSAIELLLKATLLKPVVYGLVHHEGLADAVVRNSLGQAGFDRYENLLAELFERLARIDLKAIYREGHPTKLLEESKELQKVRNNIIHKGDTATGSDAERAHVVAVAVYQRIVTPMLAAIGLTVLEKGAIKPI